MSKSINEIIATLCNEGKITMRDTKKPFLLRSFEEEYDVGTFRLEGDHIVSEPFTVSTEEEYNDLWNQLLLVNEKLMPVKCEKEDNTMSMNDAAENNNNNNTANIITKGGANMNDIEMKQSSEQVKEAKTNLLDILLASAKKMKEEVKPVESIEEIKEMIIAEEPRKITLLDYQRRRCFDVKEAVKPIVKWYMDQDIENDIVDESGFLGFKFNQNPESGWTTVGVGNSHLVIHMSKHGIDPASVCKLQAEFEKRPDLPESAKEFKDVLDELLSDIKPDKIEETLINVFAQRLLDSIARAKVLVSPDGYHYVPFGRKAGDIRKGNAMLVTEEAHDDIVDFAFLGRFEQLSKILPKAKLDVYGLLCDSSSKTYEEAFGSKVGRALKPLNLRNAIVLKDIEWKSCKTRIDKLGKDEELHMDVEEEVPETITDGLGIHILQNANKAFRKLYENDPDKIQDHTGRLNGVKLLIANATQNAFMKECDDADSTVCVDAWGVKRDIRNVEYIIFTSAFKIWKGFSSWDDYIDQLEARDIEPRVCVVCKHAVTSFPTQMVRGLHARKEFINAAVNYTVAKTDAWKTPEGAVDLVRGVIGEIGKIYPTFWSSGIADRSLQGAYASKLKLIYRGAMLDTSTTQFVRPELKPVVQIILGKKPEFILRKNRVFTCVTEPGRAILCGRAPFPMQNYIFAFNQDISEEHKDWFLGGSININWHNPWMCLAQMDFDGDKLNVTVIDTPFKKLLWEEALSAVGRMQYRPLWFEAAVEPKAYSKDAEWEDIRITSPAAVGLYDNSLTIMAGDMKKLFQKKGVSEEEAVLAYRIASAHEEKGMTTCVDQAKHNGKPSEFAMAIQEWLNSIFAKKDQCYAIKKISFNNPGEYEEEISTGKYGHAFNDPIAVFSTKMATMLPERISINNLPVWDSKTSWRPMTSGRQSKRIINLEHVPANMEERVNGKIGIWNQIVNWVKEHMVKTEDGVAVNRRQVLLDARTLFFDMVGKAELSREPERAPQADEVIDSVIARCFSRVPNANEATDVEDAQRLCLDMFGEEIIANLRRNLGFDHVDTSVLDLNPVDENNSDEEWFED